MHNTQESSIFSNFKAYLIKTGRRVNDRSIINNFFVIMNISCVETCYPGFYRGTLFTIRMQYTSFLGP